MILMATVLYQFQNTNPSSNLVNLQQYPYALVKFSRHFTTKKNHGHTTNKNLSAPWVEPPVMSQIPPAA